MKNKKLFLVLALALVMVFAMTAVAFAASITVTQDSTYSGTANQAGRTFTYSQIFHATLSGENTSEGGGYDADGTPGTVTASLAKGYSYYLDSEDDAAQIAELGSWDATTKTWTKADDNLWFKLTPSADGSQYIVEWDNTATDTDTAQAAAQWLKANYTPIASGSLTWNSTSKTWTAADLEDGYYLLSSDTGNNLIAATGDIEVAEKNSYPPVEKTQADEDNNVQTDQNKMVAVGDVLTYNVKVTIPATAKAGETIEVYDAPSKGLTYNDDMAVTVGGTDVTPAAGAAVEEAALQTGDAWRYTINVTADNIGKDVVFSFTMTVNSDALTDPDKLNPSGLIYNDYESIPDEVKFETYYAGIHKIDGDTQEDLSGVEFTLKENGVEFKVTKHTDGYYYYDKNGSSTVVTDADGMIFIRGLDNDKDYTLTETKTLDGYNLLPGDIALTLHLDTVTVTTSDDGTTTTTSSFEEAPDTDWGTVENNKGAVLPSTGGIGTTIFMVLGAILMTAAAILFITKKRVGAEK